MDFPEHTKRIISEWEPIKKDLQKDLKYTNIDPASITADDIHVLYFMIGLDPESVGYGMGTGAFVYKDGRVFCFHYTIHTTHTKGPHVSNTMDYIDEIILDKKYGIPLPRTVNSSFGYKAFWLYTPMKLLDDDAKCLRQLMESVKAYCRKEELCRKLRKTDKKHNEWRMKMHVMH